MILSIHVLLRNIVRAVPLLALPLCGAAAQELVLHALFEDKAIVLIDGKRRVLKVGEASPEGVRLVATDTRREEAELELGGRREVLRLGVVIASFQPSGKGGVTLYAEPNGHFHADGLINGAPVRFLVDTGATVIVLNSHMAKGIGLDYRRSGRPGYAQTAAGIVRTYNLKLDKVELGTILLYDVEASVIEGPFPTEALLGMSFLGRVEMRREGDRLELTQKY